MSSGFSPKSDPQPPICPATLHGASLSSGPPAAQAPDLAQAAVSGGFPGHSARSKASLRLSFWRPRSDSNRQMAPLQGAPLPFGYAALKKLLEHDPILVAECRVARPVSGL